MADFDDDTHPEPNGDLTLQTIAMPADTNADGDIFGGWLMSQMDMVMRVFINIHPMENVC